MNTSWDAELKQIVRNMVDTFKTSKRAQLWYTFTDDMRDALIDACVMDQVRSAAAWRNSQAHSFTAQELMDIRRAFVRALRRPRPSSTRSSSKTVTSSGSVATGRASPGSRTGSA